MRPFLALLLFAAALGCADSHPDAGELFEEAHDENEAGKTDRSRCSGVVTPDQTAFAKRIALTFDDGPNPETTPQIIEILRRHQAPATFFINGSRVSSNRTRELISEMVSDPLFELANHSWSHPSMRGLSASGAASQVDRTTSVIREAGGTPRYFRFPFGAANCSLTQMVQGRGYINTGWNIDSADWCYAGGRGFCKRSTFASVPDDVRGDMNQYVRRQVARKGGGILLFHDIHGFTRDQLDGLLTALEADGFTFTSLGDVTTFPLLNGEQPADGFVGDPCDSDADCNFEGSFCVPSAEVPGGYCTKMCETSCPDRIGYSVTRCVAAPDSTGATSRLCAVECRSECRDGLSCQSLASPAGGDRDVCWAPYRGDPLH